MSAGNGWATVGITLVTGSVGVPDDVTAAVPSSARLAAS